MSNKENISAKTGHKSTQADESSDSGTDSGSKGGGGKSAGAVKNGAATATKSRKKVKRQVTDGIAHINSSFNNTIVTISDLQGNVLCWATAASCGFRGSRKSTPYAAGEAAQKAALMAMEIYGIRNLDAYVWGPGPARESALRALHVVGLKVKSITDKTGIPFNGCRAPKKRRV